MKKVNVLSDYNDIVRVYPDFFTFPRRQLGFTPGFRHTGALPAHRQGLLFHRNLPPLKRCDLYVRQFLIIPDHAAVVALPLAAG